jgi:hypothetical protein
MIKNFNSKSVTNRIRKYNIRLGADGLKTAPAGQAPRYAARSERRLLAKSGHSSFIYSLNE